MKKLLILCMLAPIFSRAQNTQLHKDIDAIVDSIEKNPRLIQYDTLVYLETPGANLKFYYTYYYDSKMNLYKCRQKVLADSLSEVTSIMFYKNNGLVRVDSKTIEKDEPPAERNIRTYWREGKRLPTFPDAELGMVGDKELELMIYLADKTWKDVLAGIKKKK